MAACWIYGTMSSQKELLSELIKDSNESTTGMKINTKHLLFHQWLGDGPDAWDVSTARQENNGTPTNGTHNIIQNNIRNFHSHDIRIHILGNNEAGTDTITRRYI